MMYYYGHTGFSPLGFVLDVLFWILIVWLIVSLVRHGHDRREERWNRRMGGGSGGNKTSLDILKERYAKGEINKQEFEEKKKDITS